MRRKKFCLGAAMHEPATEAHLSGSLRAGVIFPSALTGQIELIA